MRLPTIRLNDRVAIFGITGSGKSVLAHYMFRTIPSRLPTDDNPSGFWRIAIDITDSIEDDALPFRDATHVPWDESSSLRFIPEVETMELSVNDLYNQAFIHRDVWIWLDEANEVTTAHRIIPGLRRVLLQGRKFQVGNCAVSPRPVDLARSIVTQSHHIFVFPLVSDDDRKKVANDIGMTPPEFDSMMNRLQKHGYLWYSVRDRTIYSMPALPPQVVAQLEGSEEAA